MSFQYLIGAEIDYKKIAGRPIHHQESWSCQYLWLWIFILSISIKPFRQDKSAPRILPPFAPVTAAKLPVLRGACCASQATQASTNRLPHLIDPSTPLSFLEQHRPGDPSVKYYERLHHRHRFLQIEQCSCMDSAIAITVNCNNVACTSSGASSPVIFLKPFKIKQLPSGTFGRLAQEKSSINNDSSMAESSGCSRPLPVLYSFPICRKHQASINIFRTTIKTDYLIVRIKPVILAIPPIFTMIRWQSGS